MLLYKEEKTDIISIPYQLNIDTIIEENRFNDKFLYIVYKKNKKLFIKESLYNKSSYNELLFLKKLKHSNIIKYIDSYNNFERIFLVIEYYNSDLYNFITSQKSKPLHISIISKIIKQLYNVVNWLHTQYICHGDIKLENILIHNNLIKLVDFEYAHQYSNINNTISVGNMGTIYYSPPEALNRLEYNPFKAEIWTIGVCIYVLCEYKYPFYGNLIIKEKNKLKKLINNDISFEKTPKILIELINTLLSKNANDRSFLEISNNID
tara:strand:+ start:129 stop:923 length:795 start_codon:yes stop_codon:yes gene_type:complete